MQPLRRNAPDSLRDAAAFVRARLGAARPSRTSLPELRRIQREALRDWAEARGRSLGDDPTLKLGRRAAHGEHTVAFDSAGACWWKITHSGTCGVGAEFHFDELPPFEVIKISARELLPLEYLERLILHNEHFGDDVRLEGYLDLPRPRVVISQPDIVGAPASADKMTTQMADLGFRELPGISIGRTGSISFYQPDERIAVFDAHPGNFITSQGLCLPIDGLIQRIELPAEHDWLVRRIVSS